jgi:hypothetical protein
MLVVEEAEVTEVAAQVELEVVVQVLDRLPMYQIQAHLVQKTLEVVEVVEVLLDLQVVPVLLSLHILPKHK